MSNVKFNALASLALLAGAPVVAQAEMVEMADAEMSDVNGQGLVGDTLGNIFSAVIDPVQNTAVPGTTVLSSPLISCTGGPCATYADTNGNGILDSADTIPGGATPTFGPPIKITTGAVVDNNYLPGTVGKAVGGAVNSGIDAGIGFHLLPFTGPINALGAFNSRTLSNAGSAGQQIADIAFAPIFKPIALAKQGVDTGLNYAFFPISAPLNVAGNVFTNLNNSVVGTGTRILTAPINAVFKPVNRALDTAATIGSKPVNAVLNPINNAVADIAYQAKGIATGARFSAVGAVGGATTQVLGAAATATQSRLLLNMTVASNQARLLRQQEIAKPLGVQVTVPTVKFN